MIVEPIMCQEVKKKEGVQLWIEEKMLKKYGSRSSLSWESIAGMSNWRLAICIQVLWMSNMVRNSISFYLAITWNYRRPSLFADSLSANLLIHISKLVKNGKYGLLSMNSRFVVQNDGMYLPWIMRETCSMNYWNLTKKIFLKYLFSRRNW